MTPQNTAAFRALSQALHDLSDIIRNKHEVSDDVMERAVEETDDVISAVGDRHGSPAMVAALLVSAADALEGIADSKEPFEQELPS